MLILETSLRLILASIKPSSESDINNTIISNYSAGLNLSTPAPHDSTWQMDTR